MRQYRVVHFKDFEYRVEIRRKGLWRLWPFRRWVNKVGTQEPIPLKTNAEAQEFMQVLIHIDQENKAFEEVRGEWKP